MMVWSLTAMLSLIKEFWRAVDNIVVPFQFDKWEGHILTFVQKQCFLYESIHSNPWSPFDALKPINVLTKFLSLYPDYNYNPDDIDHDPNSYFGYSEDKMRCLFSPQRSSTVHVCYSIEDVLDLNESSVNHFDGKNIIICIVSSIPESFSNNNDNDESTLILGNNIFELWYISLFESKSHVHSCSKWNSEWYTQDTVGNILLGGIRREVTVWLRNMMAILLSICLNIWYLKLTSSIALLCMSNVIVPSPIIGNRDFSGVWVVRPMSYADAITCPLSLPILSVR